MPNASGGQLTEVLVGLGAVLVAAYYVLALAEKARGLFARPAAVPPGERFVTHGEFNEFRNQLSAMQLKIERLVTLEEVRHDHNRRPTILREPVPELEIP